ncbi:MAG: hypothetical protein MUF08_18700 [Burkholderiaceae bacterium]|nr:hypothetical protein [Burkholderiaceae bacterium]
MDSTSRDSLDIGRRDLLKSVGLGAATATLAGGSARLSAAAGTAAAAVPAAAVRGPYNILFILTDQDGAPTTSCSS